MPVATKSVTTTTKRSTKQPILPLAHSKQGRHPLKETKAPRPPPSPICADINEQIRLNPIHGYPNFDFVSYARCRSYTLSTIDFGSSIGASFLDDGVHDIIADLLSQIQPTPPPTQPFFEIRDARDKGLGIFATAPISSRTTIFTEFPTIITPYLLGLSMPLAEMYTELFESLPKHAFALATSLATSHQDDIEIKLASQPPSLPPPSFYEDIMQTNSVAVNLPVPSDVLHREITTHRALFLLLSRCNHSCNPNAVWSWDVSTLSLTVTALRPIALGEEITISYIPLDGDHTVRQQALKDVYGFDCTCDECTLPPYESDDRSIAVEIVEEQGDEPEYSCGSGRDENMVDPIFLTLEEWCADSTLPNNILINAHKNALYYIEQQNLESLRSTRLTVPLLPEAPVENDREVQEYWQAQTMYTSMGPVSVTATAQAIDHHVEVIAMCYGALGDVTNFRNWIAIAKEARVRNGANPEQKVVFNRWLANPSCFPLWERKVKGVRKTPSTSRR